MKSKLISQVLMTATSIFITLQSDIIIMSYDYLKKPVLSKEIQTVKGKGFVMTSCEMQGWRRTMEDAKLHVELQPDLHLFAVFDGHGGPEVAHYVAQKLPNQILNEPYFKLRNYPRALINVFRRIDELLQSNRGEQDLIQINKKVEGPKIDFKQKIGQRAGSTAVVLLVTKETYFVANIGDSRAVLCRGGQAIALSEDHKPDLTSQQNRIQKAGGFVKQGRVNGVLSLSRAFGDFQHKNKPQKKYEEQCVISVPDIVEIDRSEDDEYILMGCDGVWQRYANNTKKMIALVSQLRGKLDNGRMVLDKLFGELVAKDAKDLLGQDNMTAILIQFK